MHTYKGILANTLESLLADAKGGGRDNIQLILTLDDVKIILDALRRNERCDTEGRALGGIGNNSPFAATVDGMLSADYKERFRAEYAQTKIRYERLKAFNNRIEAAINTSFKGALGVEMPKHDCPEDLLREQQGAMGRYLHFLEVRAVIEGIEL